MQTFSICRACLLSLLPFRSINLSQVFARLFQIQFLKVLAYLWIDIFVNSLVIWTSRLADSLPLMFFICSSNSCHILGLIQESEAHAVVVAAYAFHEGWLLSDLALGWISAALVFFLFIQLVLLLLLLVLQSSEFTDVFRFRLVEPCKVKQDLAVGIESRLSGVVWLLGCAFDESCVVSGLDIIFHFVLILNFWLSETDKWVWRLAVITLTFGR